MNNTIDRFKKTYHITDKICYCGRLDPMARGIILLLIGKECINMNQFNKLIKEYTFEILFGISTDTDDILGKILQTRVATSNHKVDISLYCLLVFSLISTHTI